MKQTRKIAAAIMAVAMTLQAAPLAGLGLTVHAEGEWSKFADGITTLGTSVISAPKAPEQNTDAWTGSYVYYGQYKNQPVKYRVLDPNTSVFGGNTMLLDCDTTLFTDAFRDNVETNSWAGSDLYKVLNTGDDAFLNTSFTGAEAAAIAESTRESHSLVVGNEAGNVSEQIRTNFVTYSPLGGEKIFLLDVEDVSNTAYGYSVTDNNTEYRRKKKFTDSDSNDSDWWLRSDHDYDFIDTPRAGCVYNGSISYNSVDDDTFGVSPAFNVSLSSVMFTSQVNDETGTYGKEYKLTLKDSNTTITPGTLARSGDTVTVPYTVTDSDAEDGITADTVSVLIKGNDGAVKYYAPLTGTFAMTGGSGTFDLPDGYADTDTIYILAEDTHEGDTNKYLTDYASEMVELDLTTELANGNYTQNAKKTVGDVTTYYTRFVFVKPKSEIEGKSKAVFSATLNGNTKTFETSTYYTGMTSNGEYFTPASEDSVMFVVTVSSEKSLEGLTCTLDFE